MQGCDPTRDNGETRTAAGRLGTGELMRRVCTVLGGQAPTVAWHQHPGPSRAVGKASGRPRRPTEGMQSEEDVHS